MTTKKRPGAGLLALTATALCLPGYSGDAQAWASPDVETGYRYSTYAESALDPNQVTSGNGERYEIETHQFRLVTPIGEGFDIATDVMYETMSGASPWYTMPGLNNKPIQVMSGATIDEERVAIDLKGRLYRESGRESFTLGTSHEKDYQSVSGGFETETEFNSRRSTISAGVGYSYDRLEPTDGGIYGRFANIGRIGAADKESVNGFVGFSQILGTKTIFQVGASASYHNGYLSDPYKLAWVNSLANTVSDTRPNFRTQWTGSARLRQYIGWANAAIHLDYRYFGDTWDVKADTVELAWYQNIGDGWKIVPTVRWYQQGAADFYRNFYNTTRLDGYYSSDYRLSAYGAVSGRLAVTKTTGKFSMSVAGEVYDSDTTYSMHNTDEANPGLVDFNVLSVSVSYRF